MYRHIARLMFSSMNMMNTLSMLTIHMLIKHLFSVANIYMIYFTYSFKKYMVFREYTITLACLALTIYVTVVVNLANVKVSFL